MNKRSSQWLRLLGLTTLLVLAAGCTTPTVRNQVTAFHEWPMDLEDRSYAFARTAEQANDLEYRSYENLLRAELARLGFEEKPAAPPARIKVKLQYSTTVRDVRVVEPVADPYYWPWGWGGAGFGPCTGPQGYYPPGIYYPGCGAPPIVQQQESRYQMYARQLKVLMTDAKTGKNLYDVTVNNDDRYGPLAEVMPYMMRAAFQDFPGQSGVPHIVEMKLPKKEARPAP